MADFGTIFATIASSSKLALELYKNVDSIQNTSLEQVASTISRYSSNVKQVGTFIQQDDTLPSPEAIEVLDDVLHQGKLILDEIECHLSRRRSTHVRTPLLSHSHERSRDGLVAEPDWERVHYLQAHLDALASTLLVSQQTLYTAQSIVWARVRPAVSPQQAFNAIDNEKIQLENAIIEQQLSIFVALRLYNPSASDSCLLMETQSDLSLVTVQRDKPGPAALRRYQDRFLASLDVSEGDRAAWLPAVCGMSRSYAERLLGRWTRLRQFQESIEQEERKMESRKREAQQPTVESDEEEVVGHRSPGLHGNIPELLIPNIQRPSSRDSAFSEPRSFSIPQPDYRHGTALPLSPASSFGASPRTSTITPPFAVPYSPVSPTLNASDFPNEVTAQARSSDDEGGLEIPWKLCTRKHYWRYVDGKIEDSNTHLPPSEAFADRNSWTEILASWVCKEAIEEQGYKYTQVQKERQVGRRTTFEPCFCIQEALTFDRVQRLVERTVEIYRMNRSPTPPPAEDQPTLDRPRQPTRERSPTATQRPPLERPATYAYLPPRPTVMERTGSLPGNNTPHLLIPKSPVVNQPEPDTARPRNPSTSQAGPQAYPSPHSPRFGTTPSPASRNVVHTDQSAPPPHRSRYSSSRHGRSSASAVSDSDSDEVRRRRHRSRSRRPSASSQKKKHSTVATLAKVGTLAALLDGIVELGVL